MELIKLVFGPPIGLFVLYVVVSAIRNERARWRNRRRPYLYR